MDAAHRRGPWLASRFVLWQTVVDVEADTTAERVGALVEIVADAEPEPLDSPDLADAVTLHGPTLLPTQACRPGATAWALAA